jgi:hypothetical protein
MMPDPQNTQFFLLHVAIVAFIMVLGIGTLAYFDTRKQTRQLKQSYPSATPRIQKPQPRWRTWLLKFKII